MQLTHSVFFAFSFMQRTRKNVQSLLPLQTLKSLYSSGGKSAIPLSDR